MKIQDQFFGYLDSVSDDDAARAFGVAASKAKKWRMRLHNPSLEIIQKFLDEIAPNINGSAPVALQVVAPVSVKAVTGGTEPLGMEERRPPQLRQVRPAAQAEALPPQAGFGPQFNSTPAQDPKDLKLPKEGELVFTPEGQAVRVTYKGFKEQPAPPVRVAPAAPAPQVIAPVVEPVEIPLEVVVEPPPIIVPSNSSEQELISAILKIKDQLSPASIASLREVFFPWEGRKLMILFPCYKFTNFATASALIAMALDIGKEKMRFDGECGDALVYHARNKLATRFVESGCDWSFWIDDDIVPPIGRADWFKFFGSLPATFSNKVAGEHVIHRLIGHKKTLIGGTYFARQAIGQAMFAEGRVDPIQDRIARTMPDKIQPTQWVGTGCMMVHRNVYLDIQKKFPELAPTPQKPYWDFFLPEINAGEDVAFCKRAQAAGHQPYVDLGVQSLHIGYMAFNATNTTPKFTL